MEWPPSNIHQYSPNRKLKKSTFSDRYTVTIFMRLHAGVSHLLSTGGLILAMVEAATGIPSVEPSVTLPRVLRPLLPSEAFERKLGNGSSSMFWKFSMSLWLIDTGLHHMRSDLPKKQQQQKSTQWTGHIMNSYRKLGINYTVLGCSWDKTAMNLKRLHWVNLIQSWRMLFFSHSVKSDITGCLITHIVTQVELKYVNMAASPCCI